MAWVVVPGYGIWPRKLVRPLSKSRIIGQASMDFLGEKHAGESQPPRWPRMSPDGLEAHKRFAAAFGVDPNRRHGFDALLELVEEEQQAFENPTPKQARDQADKMAETVRELARMGIAHDVDWLTFTSPEIRNGKPTVVIGVRPSVVVGRSPSGVPLVSVRGKPLPIAPSKIHGRPVEFRVTEVVPLVGGATEIAPLGDNPDDRIDDSTVVADNWTGTRGGWLDYAGPNVTPGGADDMGTIMKLSTDVDGMTLNPLLINALRTKDGDYVRSPDNVWSFVLSPLLRVKLRLRGVNAPRSMPADKLVCWNTVPTRPLVGAFVHPETGFHCRASSIPVEWDTAIHGTPIVQLTGDDPLGDAKQPTPLERAQGLAVAINDQIGATVNKAPKWWLYTLPLIDQKSGKPTVKIGVKGDYQPDAKELKALPWTRWVSQGIGIDVEFVPPEGSGIKGTVAKISPEGLAEVGMADDLSSAPVDSVWPTSSPDWREPTGPATGDSDQAMGQGAYNSVCPTCGQPATGVTRCVPGSYFCANGHDWPRVSAKEGSMGSHGWPARVRMPSRYLHPPALGDSGEAEDGGLGAAPIVAMPTGTLNWDRVSGYEGQSWITKDWSGQGFMSDDSGIPGLGDVTPTQPTQKGGRTMAFGGTAAVLGAAAGWALAPGGDSTRGAIAGGLVGGIAGLIVGKLIGGAEGVIESIATTSHPPEQART